MRKAVPLFAAALSLAAGGALARPILCPPGLRPAMTAELYFGRSIGPSGTVSDAQWRAFLDAEVTPRFPKGLSVSDVYGQWESPRGAFVREPAKALFLVLPGGRSDRARLDAVRAAYKRRFHQQSVLLVEQRACVGF